MIKGYFVHKFPDVIPTSFGFAFVLGKIGITTDPSFSGNWDQVSRIRRGIYQRPAVTVTDDAFNHSSYLIELCQNNNPEWNDMPLLLNIMQPNVDLTFINTWVSQLVNVLHPKEKPLLYTTPKHWSNIQKGPNAEVVSKTILQQADILSSEFNVKLPSKVLYVQKLKYWEHELGKMQYAPDGIFSSITLPVVAPPPAGGAQDGVPPSSDPTPPPPDSGGVTGVVLQDLNIHLTCPHCNQRIF